MTRMGLERSAKMQELLLLSRETFCARVDILEQAAVELLTSGSIEPTLREHAGTCAHQLVSLGTFGVHEGSSLARRAEALLTQEPLTSAAGPGLAEAALGIRDAITVALAAGAEPGAAPVPVSRARHPMHGGRVLMVEDDPLLVGLVTRALAAAGFEVEDVRDGPGALARLAQPPIPALVLLDIDLPGLDGFGVLRGIAALGLLDRVDVLVLSARGSEHDVLGTLQLGAVGHLTKPFSLPILLARVEQLTGRR
jgi:CheY-like chemotaxis protein